MKVNYDTYYEKARNHEKPLLVVFTGSGISSESGIPTFREKADSFWEKYDVMEVATADAFRKNPDRVHEFCNEMRRMFADAEPNAAHRFIAELEKYYDVVVVTQNVDDLHERSGSTDVLHLHGHINQCRDSGNTDYVFEIPVDESGNRDTFKGMRVEGHPVRPHVVLFGEDVPGVYPAFRLAESADYGIVVGTSLSVFPAAEIISKFKFGTLVYVVDPEPKTDIPDSVADLVFIRKTATEGMKEVFENLTK